MGMPAGVKMLISTPLEIRDYIRAIPVGQKVEILQSRKDLANRHGAEVTCPLTTGIFLRIVADAALEDLEKGASIASITPFWRVIAAKDKVAKKIACGPEFIAAQRESEGIP